MTRFEDMSAEDLQDERKYWTAEALIFAREYVNAVDSGQEDWWERNMKFRLLQALAQVNRLDHLLKVGVSA